VLEWAIKTEDSVYVRLTNRSCNRPIEPGVVEQASLGEAGDKSRKKLRIVVGEALSATFRDVSDVSSEHYDLMYLWAPDQLPEVALKTYAYIELWEPYSRSVITSQVKKNMAQNSELVSFTYPEVIDSGIFDEVDFVRN